MNSGCCEYCFEKLSIERSNLALGCGHAICKNCIESICKNFNTCQCPFDKLFINQDIEKLPEHKASMAVIRSKISLCPVHQKQAHYYSKISYSKLCQECIDTQQISKNDVIAEELFDNYLTDTLNEIKNRVNLLSIEYAKSLEIADYYEKVSAYGDTINKIGLMINNELYEQPLEYKLNVIRKCGALTIPPDVNFEALSSMDIEYLERLFLKAISDLAIQREKRLLKSGKDVCAWNGNTLSSYYAPGQQGRFIFKFRIEAPGPFRVTAIGFGAEFYESSPIEYLTLEITSQTYHMHVPTHNEKPSGTSRLTREFKVNSMFNLDSNEEFRIKFSTGVEKIYCLVPSLITTSGQYKLHHLSQNHQISQIFYIKLASI